MTQWHGVFAVPVTPFTSDGSGVDEEGLEANARFMADAGLPFIVAAGTTGEFLTLTAAELDTVCRATVEAVGDRAAVVVGVGGPVATAVEQAQRAAASGATAVMIHHPAHPFATADGIVAYFLAIAEGVELPVIPYLRVGISGDVLLELAGHPGVVAVKYAVKDPAAFGAAVATTRDCEVSWLCGLAERWAPAFSAAGSVGFTSGIAAVEPRLPLGLHEALVTGHTDRAIDLWRLALPFEELRGRDLDSGSVAVLKEALRLRGMAAGPVRPPGSNIPLHAQEVVEQILSGWDQALD